MMRRMFSVGLAAALALCVVGTASATTTIDITFGGGAGGPTVVNITPGFGVVTMSIFMTTTDNLTIGLTTITWNNPDTIADTGTVEWATFVQFVPVISVWSVSTSDGPGGVFIDNPNQSVYTFGGNIGVPNDPPNLTNGTYQMGTIVFNHSSPWSTTVISSGLFAGIDVFGSGGTTIAASFGSATINVIPEPATASLLGLGLVGLILAGRRKRA